MLRKALALSPLFAGCDFPIRAPELIADLESTADLESVADVYLENTHAFTLSNDVESNTLQLVEEATEATLNYNSIHTQSVLSEDYAGVTAAYSQELLTGAPDELSISTGGKESVSVLV